ncbi:MAG: AmmeMemoRadiSam system protein A [Desulfatiglandales bacterium]
MRVLLALLFVFTSECLCLSDTIEKEGLGMEKRELLSEEEGRLLLRIARETIKQRLFAERAQIPSEIPPTLRQKKGTFVTITIGGHLRGCIGHILPVEDIIDGVKENAINAAFRDPRFPPLSREEFDKIQIEVSVLTTPKRLEYKGPKDLLEKLRPNVDGVIIKKGTHQATFLPQVWEQLPQKEEFLSHLCMKAGLSPDEWKKGTLEVETYQVQAFHEK